MKWKKVEIKKYINQIRGIAYSSKDVIKSSKEGYLPVLRSNGIKEGKIVFENLVYVPKWYIKDAQKLREGDILITASTGSKKVIGKNGQILENFEGSFGAFCKVVRPKNKTLDRNYLKHFFQSQVYRETIRSVINGANINNIKNNHIDDLTIPLPPLPIQQQIADLLDTADALCRTTAEQLQQLDDLAESVFLEMFGDVAKNEKGWKIDLLGNNFSTKKAGTKCGPFGSALKKHEYIEKGVPVWVMDNIKKDKFSPNRCLFITSDKYETLKSYSVEKGDIIISRAGTVGKMCVIDTDIPTSIIHSNIIRLSLNENKILPIYFTLLMKYAKGRVGKLKKGDEGAYSFMNTGILKKLKIPIPPLKKQTEFAKIIENIEVQKVELKQSLQDSEDLFKGLLQEIFN
jgi:type I restriction enzyme S subunit